MWRPVIGQELPVFPEQRRAVAIYRDGVTVSHVPREMVCLKHDGKTICEITGRKRPLKIFIYLEQYTYYPVSRQILSRKQHVPNK